MSLTLPRFYRQLQKIADAQKLTRILLETGGELPEEERATVHPSARGGDRRRMRGLPIVGPGVGGTSPGTDPLGALLAKERRLRSST